MERFKTLFIDLAVKLNQNQKEKIERTISMRPGNFTV